MTPFEFRRDLWLQKLDPLAYHLALLAWSYV